VLTWEAKKEAIFEMPVRAKRYRSNEESRAASIPNALI
jgi:hypothetical protein